MSYFSQRDTGPIAGVPLRPAVLLFLPLLLPLLAAVAGLLTGCASTTATSVPATSQAPPTSGGSTPTAPPTAPPAVPAAAPAPPTFSPASGVYTAAQSISLGDTSAGAVIYYTTDGTIPTTGSFQYVSPITAATTTTITAVAVAGGGSTSAGGASAGGASAGGASSSAASATASAPVVATYTIAASGSGTGGSGTGGSGTGGSGTGGSGTGGSGTPVQPTPTPTPTPASGQTLAIADATSGALIYYTTDGTTPTINSARYTAPITVANSETVKAIAVAAGFSSSAVGQIVVSPGNQAQVAAPTVSVPAGSYPVQQTVALADSTAGAAIYYTTDGTTPSANSALYVSPITVASSQTLSAIGIFAGYSNSGVAIATYTIGSSADGGAALATLSLHNK